MVATWRAFVAATWSALALVRSESLPAEASSEPRNRKGGVTKNRNLASCETVAVTGGYGYTAGVYGEDGSRNGVEAYASSDGSSQLFYSDREASDDDNRRRRRQRQRQRLLLPEDLFGDIVGEEEGQEEAWEGGEGGAFGRRLGACSGGFWSLAPAGGGYPQLRVSDCAQHPADIKVNTWTQVTCADCSEQTYNGDMPEVECFIPPASTPSPSPPSPSSPSDPPTSGAAPEDDDASAGGSVDEDPSSGAPVDGGDGSCKVLDVGGRYPGLYTVVGSYNGRGDYYSENQKNNIFFEVDSSSSSSSSGQGDDDDKNGDDDNRRRVLLDEVITAHKARGGRGEGGRGLAACDSGYWIKTPTGGGYPFFALADCAVFPENIAPTASWLIITCAGCDAGPATAAQAIACATGEDAFVATPSPVPPVQNAGSGVGDLPGAGTTTCEEVTVTGVRGGGYTVTGEVNDRADLLSDDGNFRMFFTGPAPALETYGERMRRLVSGEDYRDVPFDPFAAEVARSRGLQEICEGFWYIIPSGDKYPAYAVSDCAVHPVDIVNTNWLYLDCEDCAVVTANPKPATACTGAPANIKRGGSWVTPSPAGVVEIGGVTPSPVASASSTCETLVVTGDYPGNFTANGTYRGKLDFFNNDHTVNLYFELATSRRALMAGEQDGAGQRRSFPGDAMASALSGAAVTSRSLAVCTSGFWIMAPVGGIGYPVFGVPDCAQHPADIRANTWLVASCESCGVQDAPSFVAPTIFCAGQEGANTEEGAPTPTPAPATESNCGVVYVTGPAAGVYKERGTQGNRGDFFSNNRVWNLYWAFYAGKPVNRNRFRRGLSGPDGVYGQGGGERRSKERDWALEAFASGWRGEEGLGLDKPHQQRKGGEEGEGEREGAVDRRLEFCEDGFWLITPRGGGFPFYGTQNCASHPADISPNAVWSVVQCDGCGSEVSNQTVTVSCNGAGFTPPPSPTVQATRAPVDAVGGAGDEGAATRTRPDARLAATVLLSLVALVVGAAVTAL